MQYTKFNCVLNLKKTNNQKIFFLFPSKSLRKSSYMVAFLPEMGLLLHPKAAVTGHSQAKFSRRWDTKLSFATLLADNQLFSVHTLHVLHTFSFGKSLFILWIPLVFQGFPPHNRLFAK